MNRRLLLALGLALVAGCQFAAPAEARKSKPPSLLVKSKPSGADITLTGPTGETLSGRTPFKIKNVTPGEYSLVITKHGFSSVQDTLQVAATGKTKVQYRLQKSSGQISEEEKNRRAELLESRLTPVRRQVLGGLFAVTYAATLPQVSGGLYFQPVTGYYYRVTITPQQDGTSLHTFTLYLDQAELLPAGQGSFTVRPGAIPFVDGTLNFTAGRAAGLSGDVTSGTPGQGLYGLDFRGTMGNGDLFTSSLTVDIQALQLVGGGLFWGPTGNDEQAGITLGAGGLLVTGVTPGGAEIYEFLFDAAGNVLGRLTASVTSEVLAELSVDVDGNGVIIFPDGSFRPISAP